MTWLPAQWYCGHASFSVFVLALAQVEVYLLLTHCSFGGLAGRLAHSSR